MESNNCVVRLDPCHMMTSKRCRNLLMTCTGITVCCGLALLGLGVASTTFVETTFTSMTKVDIQHIRSSTTGIGIAMLFLTIWGFFSTLAGRVIFLNLYVVFLLLFAAVEVIMTAIIAHALTKYRHLNQESSTDCMNGLCQDAHSVTALLAPTALIFTICTCIHLLAAWSAYLLNFEFRLRKRESAVRQIRNRSQPLDNRDLNHNYTQNNPDIILHREETLSCDNFLDTRPDYIGDESDAPYFTQVVVPGKKSSFRSYAHHQSIGDISALQPRREKNKLDVADRYSHSRAKSCDNLSSPRPEITVSFIEDSGNNAVCNHPVAKDTFIKVNVEPYMSIHLPVKRPSQTSYDESHTRDLCHMEMGYFKGEPFKSYDDSVFMSGPDIDDYNDMDYTIPREAQFSASNSMYKVEEDSAFRYERRTSTDIPSYTRPFPPPDLNSSIQGKVYKRKTPREVKRQNMTSKMQGGGSEYGSLVKGHLDQEVFEMNQRDDIQDFRPMGDLAHIKDATTGKLKPSYLSLPGLHLGEKFYSLKMKEKNPKSRSMEILCDTDNDNKLGFTQRPRSVAESSFPVSFSRNESSQALMKSIFSGTYWKENGPDNSISSVDLQNSLMASRSSISKPVPKMLSPVHEPNPGGVEEQVVMRSCVDINSSTAELYESNFGRSMLRKSVIDPSVAQSFHRSQLQQSQLQSPQTTPAVVYKTPMVGSATTTARVNKLSRSNSDDDLSFVSFHSARQGDISQKQRVSNEDDSDMTQNTCSSIPTYNYDEELDHCLNQMMLLASELQKKEFGQPHDEAGIEVSPLVRSGKSRSCSALMHMPAAQGVKRHGVSPSGSLYSARPYSRESAGSRGSASSQCSVGFKAHNNSHYSAESMII